MYIPRASLAHDSRILHVGLSRAADYKRVGTWVTVA